jgi:hypothetical protein
VLLGGALCIAGALVAQWYTSESSFKLLAQCVAFLGLALAFYGLNLRNRSTGND